MTKEMSPARRAAVRKWLKAKDRFLHQVESNFLEEERWKSEGCLCGASPGEIFFISRRVNQLLGSDFFKVKYQFRCKQCGRDYDYEKVERG